MEFLIIISLILLFIVWNYTRKLSSRIFQLQIQIWDLETKLKNLQFDPPKKEIESSIPSIAQEEQQEVKVSSVQEKMEPVQTETIPVTVPKIPTPPVIEKPIQEIITPPRKPVWTPLLELWNKVENPILENWTGILGAVILVMGVGFLGIYGAIFLDPFWRSMIIAIFAGLLYGTGFYIRSKKNWEEFSLVLQSTGGAILLLDCIGMTDLDGLKWIENYIGASFAILLGVGINLWIGYKTNRQLYLTLHSILTLLALSFVPVLIPTLLLGIVTVALSLYKNYTEKWEWNLFILLTGFFGFEFYKIIEHENLWKENEIQRVIILILNIFIYSFALLVHYKNVLYENIRIERFPLFNHLLTWFYFGLTMLILSTGNPLNSIVLGISSIGVFFASSKAKKKGILWLFSADRFIALFIAYAFAISLEKWQFSVGEIFSILGLETILFNYLSFREDIPFMRWMGLVLSYLISLGLGISFFLKGLEIDTSSQNTLGEMISYGIFLGFSFFIVPKITKTIEGTKSFTLAYSGLEILVGLLTAGLTTYFWNGYGGVGTFGIVSLLALFWREFLKTRYLLFGLWGSLGLSSIYIWSSFNYPVNTDLIRNSFWLISLLLLPLASIFLSGIKNKFRMTRPGIYLFTINFSIGSIYFFEFYSDFVAPLLFISLCLFYLLVMEGLKKVSRNFLIRTFHPDRGLQDSGFFLLAILSSLLYYLPGEMNNSDRFINLITIKLASLGTIGFWIHRTYLVKNSSRFFQTFKPLLWEIGIVTAILILVEFSFSIIIFILSSYTILLLLLSRFRKNKRFIFYSLLIQFLLSIAFINRLSLPEDAILNQEWSLGILGTQILFSFFLFGYPRFRSTVFPKILGVFNLLTSIVSKFRFFFYFVFLSILTLFVFLEINYLLEPISNLSIGVAWISLSPILLEGTRFVKNKEIESRKILHILSFLTFFLYLLHLILVGLQSESYLWIFPIKVYIEIYGILVLVYWYNYQENHEFESKYSAYAIEIGLVFSIFLLDAISPQNWKPISFSLLSFGLLFLGQRKQELSRFKEYSLFMHWFVLFQLAFLSEPDSPSSNFLDSKWFIGLVGLGVQVYYLYLRYKEEKAEVSFPIGLGFLSRINQIHESRKDLTLFYPLFASGFLFLYYGFESAILTLLWTLLSFVIFILSITIGKKHFLYSSLGLLVFCVIRLIFHDMSSSSTIMKAIVFLGVGSILLFMNSLHNKFKDRF